ncbi:MAG: MarR family transcriptional regulator [Candidatus Syntropharchaeia archaeon]
MRVEQLFLQSKPVRILLSIERMERPYAHRIAKEVDATFSHTINVLSEMEDLGLIKFSKSGRTKYIELTDYGKKIVEAFKNLIAAFGAEETKRRIEKLSSKVEKVFEEEIKGKEKITRADGKRIAQRLGPYKREILKLQKIAISDKTMEEEIEKIKNRIEELIETWKKSCED